MSDLTERFSRENLAFWGALAAALAVLIWPVWMGPIFPAWDWGGHLAMADAWARLEEVELYGQIYERRSGIVPNILSARFVGWMYPLVEPLAALRLFTSLVMLSTVAALLAVARTFGRSRWLVFLCLPFLWNGSFYFGMINYVAVFPLLFAGVALSARTAETGEWRYAVGLGSVVTASFFVHGLGCLFTVAAGGLIYVLSLRRLRRVWGLLLFAPAIALWMYWRANIDGQGLPSSGIIETLQNAAWFGPVWILKRAYKHSLDVTSLPFESWVLGGLGLAWVMAAMAALQADSPSTEDDPPGFFYEYRLHLLAFALVLAVFATPGYIQHTNINTRFVPLALWTLALVPRAPTRHLLTRGAAGLAIVVSLSFGVHLVQNVERLHRQEFDSLVEVIDQIPPQSTVDCMQVGYGTNPVFRGRALQHNCPGLLHVRRDSYGEFGFPDTAFNPITFRRKDFPVRGSLGGWHDLGGLQTFGYLIIRGDHHPPPTTVTRRAARAGGRPDPDLEPGRTHTTEWTLYRVLNQEFDATHREVSGGPGGQPFQWTCPEGAYLDGFSGRIDANETVTSLRPTCHASEDGRNATRGPQIGATGGARRRVSARCPDDSMAVGVEGRAGRFVDQLNLLCAPIETATETGAPRWNASKLETIEGGGGTGGEPFRITCPTASAAASLIGRNGARIDAVGVACRTLPSPR